MGCSITTLDLVSCLLGVQLSSERTITTPCASLDYRPVTIIDSSRRRRAGTPDERSAHRCEGPSIDVGRSTAAKGSGGVVFRALALARTQCAQRFRHSGGSLCSRGTVPRIVGLDANNVDAREGGRAGVQPPDPYMAAA